MAHNNKGFTIIELMISITILSITILLFTYGAIQISRGYQKANVRINLLSATREIHSNFAQSLQLSGLDVTPTYNSGAFEVTCLGGVRYIRYGNATLQTDPNYGLLYSQDLNGATICTSPITIASATLALPAGTRATQFSLTGASIFTLSSRFVAGTKDVFESSDFTMPCISSARGGQYCAAVQLTSTVTRKVQ